MQSGKFQPVKAVIALLLITVLTIGAVFRVHAEPSEGFALQVSPSPLVVAAKPGEQSNVELQLRNINKTPQALKMGMRSFTVDDATGDIRLGDAASAEIQSLVSFETPNFTLGPGEIFTQRITVHPDVHAGFSYNFAIVISQQNPPKSGQGKSAIAGMVAVFTLIDIEKPGATRSFTLNSFGARQHSYEYLPAEFLVKLKSTGTTNVQPTGSVFIQRHSSDTVPLATVPINKNAGYVLPGKERTFIAAWGDGFPRYETVHEAGEVKKKLMWQGGISKLRMGRYVAKLVAVYNDGQRDVPVMAEVSFWVIPWRLLACGLVVIAVLGVGFAVTLRSFGKAMGGASRRAKHAYKSRRS